MALSILDGTQTATTLSTILSSGQHITAHTVVSLGTQAKTDILSAVSSGIAISGTVTIGNTVNFRSVNTDDDLVDNISSAIINSPLPAGTNRIGVVTASLSAGTAQIGSVTASISGTVTANVGNAVNLVGGGYSTLTDLFANESIAVSSLPAISGTVTASLSAGTAQIGSVTASLAISSTAITSGSFASLTSATLVPGNTARKMATVYNLGAGQLFVNAGATATTLGGGFMVALSSGDFYECNYTTTTLSAIFATAGTASWVSH